MTTEEKRRYGDGEDGEEPADEDGEVAAEKLRTRKEELLLEECDELVDLGAGAVVCRLKEGGVEVVRHGGGEILTVTLHGGGEILTVTLHGGGEILTVTACQRVPIAENHSLRSVIEEGHEETEETEQGKGDRNEGLFHLASDETNQIADGEGANKDEQKNGLHLHALSRIRPLDVQENRPRQEDSHSDSLKRSRYG